MTAASYARGRPPSRRAWSPRWPTPSSSRRRRRAEVSRRGRRRGRGPRGGRAAPPPPPEPTPEAARKARSRRPPAAPRLEPGGTRARPPSPVQHARTHARTYARARTHYGRGRICSGCLLHMLGKPSRACLNHCMVCRVEPAANWIQAGGCGGAAARGRAGRPARTCRTRPDPLARSSACPLR